MEEAHCQIGTLRGWCRLGPEWPRSGGRLKRFLALLLVVLPTVTRPIAVRAAGHRTERTVIGMNGDVDPPVPGSENPFGYLGSELPYSRALSTAGAVPIHLVPVASNAIGSLLDRVDGLLLCGGPDIDPARYGERPHGPIDRVAPEREDFDIGLFREAERRRMPVLGICLGSQIINVARGGTLIQDIPQDLGESEIHRASDDSLLEGEMHEICFEPGTRLSTLYPTPRIRVNSNHHQAASELGRGLRLAARARDSVTEAFEDPSLPFLIGVQYHPELQISPPGLHAKLFREFVRACQDYREHSGRRWHH